MKTGKKAEQWQQCVRKDTGEKGIISLTLVQKKKKEILKYTVYLG